MKLKKIFLIFALSIIFSYVHGQDKAGKFSSALGIGPRHNYNDMLYPYEFKGIDYSLNLGWQQISTKNWLSDIKIFLHYAPLYTSNGPILITSYNAIQYIINADMHYQLGKKIAPLSGKNFSLFAGGSIDFMACYQVFYDTYTAYSFSLIDASLGVFLTGNYKVGKIMLSDNFSTLLFAGAFYPHYGNANPFTASGTAASYFVTASIGKLNRINNYFKVEFPVFIKSKLWNTFFIGYNFTYEYSTIRDNPVHNVGHSVLVGMVFAIHKTSPCEV
jgi:hypothetical protein